MLNAFRTLSLPKQLSIGSFIAIVAIFVALVASIEHLFRTELDKIVTDHQLTQASLVAHQLESEYTLISQSIARSATAIDLILSRTLTLQNKQILFDNKPLQNSPTFLNDLKQTVEAEVAVFIKEGQQLTPVSSTDKNISMSLTAPKTVGNTSTFNGEWRIGDHYYFAQIQTLTDQPSIAFAILVPYKQLLSGVKNALSDIKFGKSGYVYVTDTDEREGLILVHPTDRIMGQNIYDLFPSVKSEFTKMYRTDKGVIRYSIQVPGQDTAEEESKAIFSKVDGWNWVVTIKTYSSEYQAEINAILITIALICATAALILAGVLWQFIRRALRPLDAISVGINEIGRGNLNYRFPSTVTASSKNETHQLQYTLQTMRDSLKTLIQHVYRSSEHILDAAHTISVANKQVAFSANQSNDACSEVAAAISQMSVSVEEVALSANEVAGETVSVREITDKGVQSVQQIERTVSNLSTSFEQAEQTIQAVESSTNNIGAVVTVINEIAEQTNLLALNAAIEAARAGEQGRGFAVVADEVRVLAQRTQQSTKEIKAVVDNLQNGSRSAVSTMKQGRAEVEKSVQQASEAGQLIRRITDSMAIVSQGMSNVAAATEEQSVAAIQVKGNADTLRQAADATASEASKSQQQSERIHTLAIDLQHNLSHFTLK